MFPDIRGAVFSRDKSVIHSWVDRQIAAGASALDVNVGASSDRPQEAMVWLVDAIREKSLIPLSIDTTKEDVMRAGLAAAGKNGAIINSSSADAEKLSRYLSLAAEHGAGLIVLTMTKEGLPRDAESRVDLAGRILTRALEAAFPVENLFIDPILLPVNVAQSQMISILEAIAQIKLLSEPSPRIILGLSNLSQKAKEKALLNRTFLAMAMARGLDAAICDATDRSLRDTLRTAEILLNKQIYCDDYLHSSDPEIFR